MGIPTNGAHCRTHFKYNTFVAVKLDAEIMIKHYGWESNNLNFSIKKRSHLLITNTQYST